MKNPKMNMSGLLAAGFGGRVVTRAEVLKYCEANNLRFPDWIKNYKTGWGKFDLTKLEPAPKEQISFVTGANPVESVEAEKPVVMEELVTTVADKESFVPKRFRGYVPFGHFPDIEKIITSNMFYTFYVTGLSGNGKTLMIEEICARNKRECVRANVTIETDEDDLIGGFRLIGGETIWQDGPVITAMKRGALLLLDEVDLGSHKMMCLQPILEGKPVYLKKINQIVRPADGFNICATANTKGRGSDDGKFVGTMVMNEAFLERFSVTFEQEYPDKKVEEKILNTVLENNNSPDKDFADRLTQWSEGLRNMYVEGQINDMISTRRLVHICNAFAIFGQDREKAISLCLNRFDGEGKAAFTEYYSKIDAKIKQAEADRLAKIAAEEAQRKRNEAMEIERKKREEFLKNNPPARGTISPAAKSTGTSELDKVLTGKGALDLEKDFPF